MLETISSPKTASNYFTKLSEEHRVCSTLHTELSRNRLDDNSRNFVTLVCKDFLPACFVRSNLRLFDHSSSDTAKSFHNKENFQGVVHMHTCCGFLSENGAIYGARKSVQYST